MIPLLRLTADTASPVSAFTEGNANVDSGESVTVDEPATIRS